MGDIFYKGKDIIFTTQITKDGVLLPTSSFLDAYYVIGENSGNILVEKTLGAGITTIDANTFQTHIEDTDLNFSGEEYTHEFVVIDTNNHILPPVFQRKLNIIKTLK